MASSDFLALKEAVSKALQRFKPFHGSFSVVSLCIYEETCISLDSPIHAEQNGLCPNSVYQSIRKL